MVMLTRKGWLPCCRVPSVEDLGNARFDAHMRVLSEPTTVRAVSNIVLVVLGSTIVIAMSCLIGWFSVWSVGSSSGVQSRAAALSIVMVAALMFLVIPIQVYAAREVDVGA